MGMNVLAVDNGPEKEQLCRSLGIDDFIDFGKVPDVVGRVMAVTEGGAAGVIVSAGSRSAYEQVCILLVQRHLTRWLTQLREAKCSALGEPWSVLAYVGFSLHLLHPLVSD
jgi:NADPH:quinone reductase-like Zn-dependent oxidoreductase